MRVGKRRVGRGGAALLTLVAAAATLGVAAPSDAGRIPGGGTAKADCYAELEVAGIENPSQLVQQGKVVLCTDGEACDTGPCGDDQCDVQVSLCINQTDPNVPSCTPPAGLDGVKVKAQGKVKLNVQVPQPLQGPSCGPNLDGTVPVKLDKQQQPKGAGKAKISVTAKAVKGTKPRTDGDRFTIKCLPRTAACPAPTTTTTPPTTTTTLPSAPVSVTASIAGNAVPGGTLTATADIQVTGGCTVQSIAWTKSSNAPVTIGGADTASATVGLPAEGAFKTALFAVLAEPPIAEDQFPPNVPLPEGEFPGGIQDRFELVGLSPLAVEEAGLLTLEVTVTASCGTASDTVDVHTELPWKPAAGVRDVPVGVRALLHGKGPHCSTTTATKCLVDGDCPGGETCVDVGRAYDWALTPPATSSATLIDATAQNPEFTPDVAGLYTFTVTDTTKAPPASVTLEVYADKWQGAITGQDADGRPLAAGCTGCHQAGGFAPDMFTPWAQTGHADIFTNNLNTSTHYGEDCFTCHTVGFNKDVDNDGMDDAPDYQAFLAAGLLNNPGDNWTTMLANFPQSARLANIQCENCHGPQKTGAAHMDQPGEPRKSLSSDVCAVCHGEPLRHARFQQWQLSGHANYELAMDEGTSGSCARCHSVNGFLAWEELGYASGSDVTVTWTRDDVHPQTCVTCHDPHNEGTTTGDTTDAPVRIEGNTPLLVAGFTAYGVGKGAMCMTCHNSRRGLRNDGTFPTLSSGKPEFSRAPHPPTQTDLLMGENAYLVDVGVRGSHSFIENTCVNCHMVQTPPPAALSYQLGGTNHTFFASEEICSNCHGDAFNAEGVEAAFEASHAQLEQMLEQAILDLITQQITAGNVIVVSDATIIDDVGTIEAIAFGESHGRQGITITFTDDTTLGPVSLSDVDVVLPPGTAPTTCAPGSSVAGRCELYDFADNALPKAGWNSIVVNDGSKGVHNPNFVFRVLNASISALAALAP
jgi:hypothetical protein